MVADDAAHLLLFLKWQVIPQSCPNRPNRPKHPNREWIPISGVGVGGALGADAVLVLAPGYEPAP